MERQGAKPPRSEPSPEIDHVAYATIGAALSVHRALGPGYAEALYEEALTIEMRHRGMRFDRQLRVPIVYREHVVGEHVLDLVIEGVLVVELKAIEQLASVHYAQLHSYLKSGAYDLGLLINFNVAMLKDGIRRVIVNRAEGAF